MISSDTGTTCYGSHKIYLFVESKILKGGLSRTFLDDVFSDKNDDEVLSGLKKLVKMLEKETSLGKNNTKKG